MVWTKPVIREHSLQMEVSMYVTAS